MSTLIALTDFKILLSKTGNRKFYPICIWYETVGLVGVVLSAEDNEQIMLSTIGHRLTLAIYFLDVRMQSHNLSTLA